MPLSRVVGVLSLLFSMSTVASLATTVTVSLDGPGKAISADQPGIFFEDLSYAADGGLYGELVQNRSFEYQAVEQPTWNNLTSWELVTHSGKGTLGIDAAFPIHPNNPHYAVLAVETPGEGVGLVNHGYDGIPVSAGENYEISFFARENFIGGRWTDIGKSGKLPLVARLESKDGTVLAEAPFEITEREWRRFSATLTANRTDSSARLVLLATARGGSPSTRFRFSRKKPFTVTSTDCGPISRRRLLI